jgi:hypothetical protein
MLGKSQRSSSMFCSSATFCSIFESPIQIIRWAGVCSHAMYQVDLRNQRLIARRVTEAELGVLMARFFAQVLMLRGVQPGAHDHGTFKDRQALLSELVCDRPSLVLSLPPPRPRGWPRPHSCENLKGKTAETSCPTITRPDTKASEFGLLKALIGHSKLYPTTTTHTQHNTMASVFHTVLAGGKIAAPPASPSHC